MLKNMRMSVMVLITLVVLGGLSILPSKHSSVIQAARSGHYQTMPLSLSVSNGHWSVNGSSTRGLVVSIPPQTSIELTLDEQLKSSIQSVQFFPIHETKRRQFQVFPATTTNGLLIDASQLKLGKYTCKVSLDSSPHGASSDIVFKVAVTPASSRPNMVNTGTK